MTQSAFHAQDCLQAADVDEQKRNRDRLRGAKVEAGMPGRHW